MAYNHRKRMGTASLFTQKWAIDKEYGDRVKHSEVKKGKLIAVLKLQPSHESCEYEVRIEYSAERSPRAWLLNPPLIKLGKLEPHHLYSPDRQGHPQLCVYHPKSHEWQDEMLIATSFIPWVLTWLNAYEYWICTGEWLYPEVVGTAKKE